MSLADWINGTAGTAAKVATVAVAKPQTPKTVFTEVDHSGIESGQVATATHAALAALATHDWAELPADLIKAATRCCVEIHQDGPKGLAAMLDDLQHYPPASWPWLAGHLKRQLPDPLFIRLSTAAPTVCCGECQHGTTTDHPSILSCGLGIPSGLPINGRWSTDRHGCERFAALIRPID